MTTFDGYTRNGQRERRIHLDLDADDRRALAETFAAAMGDRSRHEVANAIGLSYERVSTLFRTALFPRRNAHTVHAVAAYLGIDDDTLTADLSEAGAGLVRRGLATLRRSLEVDPEGFTPAPLKAPAAAKPREARVGMASADRRQLGQLVRRTRASRRVEAPELAEATDVPDNWIRSLELAWTGSVWRDRFRAVADALGIDREAIAREIPRLDPKALDALFAGPSFGVAELLDPSDRIPLTDAARTAISELITRTREAHALTPEALADAAGVTPLAVRNLEKPGFRSVSATRLRAVCDALGIGEDELRAVNITGDESARTIIFTDPSKVPGPHRTLHAPIVLDDETLRLLSPTARQAVEGAILARGMVRAAGHDAPAR